MAISSVHSSFENTFRYVAFFRTRSAGLRPAATEIKKHEGGLAFGQQTGGNGIKFYLPLLVHLVYHLTDVSDNPIQLAIELHSIPPANYTTIAPLFGEDTNASRYPFGLLHVIYTQLYDGILGIGSLAIAVINEVYNGKEGDALHNLLIVEVIICNFLTIK